MLLTNIIIYRIIIKQDDLLAQLAEQLTLNQWVWGSNPQESTIYVYKSMSRLYFFEKNIAYTTCVWYYQ